MRGFLKFAAGLSLAMTISAGQAQAATFILDYTATNGANPAVATLVLDVSDTLNAVGGYDVTNVSGHVDADAITGIIHNPSQPFTSYSPDGWFIFDNVLWPDNGPVVSNPGLFFSGASGAEYNFFSDDATTYELYTAWPGVGYGDHSVGVISLAEAPPSNPFSDLGNGVPEPATWTMMILGFGAVGATMRRRRGQATLA